MKDFNSYLDNLDYSLVKDLFHEKGKQRIYHKKDFFIRQNEISRFAEWVENGTFQYTYIDGEGEEHIVGYAFTCLLYTSPSPRDAHESRMPSSA